MMMCKCKQIAFYSEFVVLHKRLKILFNPGNIEQSFEYM